MARLFGDTALGPVFYADSGEALPVTEDERDVWLAHAQRAIDGHVAQRGRIPVECAVIALVLIFAFQAARALLGGVVPILAAIPAPAAALPALAWPLIDARRYSAKLARLRRDFAEGLQFRQAMPEDIATPHRRYNLFAILSVSLACVAVGLFLLGAMRGGFDHYEALPLPVLLLLVPAWLLHFAARRVDAVHRRRPESLERSR